MSRLDEHGYPRAPRDVTPDTWFYEERKGLLVVLRRGSHIVTGRIPWRYITRAVDRHRKNKARR